MRIVRFTRRFTAGLVFGLAIAALSGCGGGGGGSNPTPTQPSSPPPATGGFSGTWKGSASDSSGAGQMSWQLADSGGSLSGTATITDTTTGLTGRGSLSGSASGSAIQFTLTFPAGGFDSPYNACTASVSGNGQISASTITAPFSGSNSCTGAISGGQLTLNKQ